MSLIARRAVRWWTRTLWMARAVADDFGLNTETRVRRGVSPLWLRENPFLARTMRSETRRFPFFWRFVIMLLLTGAALVGVLTLNQEFPAFMRILAANVFGASAPTLAAAAVITVQTVLITATRTALSPSLATEARRQTLDGLLVTPVRPAEMILAMTIGPLRGSLLMGLAALPLYVLIQQLGGME
ncbi:MAG: hypothetical protein JWQ02_1892, partial [Capsulimonas sp.]|nr:hypothetical protein [Capsulimonas sp.]